MGGRLLRGTNLRQEGSGGWNGFAMKHRESDLRVDDAHDDLRLKEGVGELRILEKHIAGLVGIVLDAQFHLFHQFEHLLGWEGGDGPRNGFGCFALGRRRSIRTLQTI